MEINVDVEEVGARLFQKHVGSTREEGETRKGNIVTPEQRLFQSQPGTAGASVSVLSDF
jgi:hypothetical protein